MLAGHQGRSGPRFSRLERWVARSACALERYEVIGFVAAATVLGDAVFDVYALLERPETLRTVLE
jgi:hypothetical protein